MTVNHRRATDRPRETIRNWRPLSLIVLRSAVAMVATVCALAGCALSPNTVRVQGEHMSHIGQHFGGNQSHFGAEYAEVIARWQIHGAYVDVGQGYNLSSGIGVVAGDACAGGICGPRELTTVAVGYEWRLK